MPQSGLDFQVRRTKPVSPSKLGLFSQCPLRYVLETEHPAAEKLPAGPIALRGTAAHRVIEQLSGKPMPAVQEIRHAFCAALAIAVEEDSSPLVRIAYRQAGLGGLFNAEQVASACQFVRKVLAKRAGTGPAQGGKAGAPRVPGQLAVFGPERKLASATLGMEGRADLVYRDAGGAVCVADFKTGSVLGADGGPRVASLLQVAAYGLLVKEMLSLDDVALVLSGPASEWQGRLAGAIEEAVTQTLADLRARLPLHQPVQAAALAAPGQSCRSCASRPLCPAYLLALHGGPSTEGVLPSDIAATVAEVAAEGGFLRIRATASGGRSVSLSGLPVELYADLAPGTGIEAFALGFFDVLSRAAFPANFYVFRSDKPGASAFSSLVRTVRQASFHRYPAR